MLLPSLLFIYLVMGLNAEWSLKNWVHWIQPIANGTAGFSGKMHVSCATIEQNTSIFIHFKALNEHWVHLAGMCSGVLPFLYLIQSPTWQLVKSWPLPTWVDRRQHAFHYQADNANDKSCGFVWGFSKDTPTMSLIPSHSDRGWYRACTQHRSVQV